MRTRFLFAVVSLFAPLGVAQRPPSKTLSELLQTLPQLVHSKTMNFAAYSDEVLSTFRADPQALSSAVPIIKANLHDPDPMVQFETLALVHGFATEVNDRSVILKHMNEIASIISVGDQYSQKIAMLNVSDLGEAAPEQVVAPIRNLLNQSDIPEAVTLVAGETLMVTRGREEQAQTQIVSLINDQTRSRTFRKQLLFVTSTETSGDIIKANLNDIARNSGDRELRDAALAGTVRVGPGAIQLVESKLLQMSLDPSESVQSHLLVEHALRKLQKARAASTSPNP
jgi:hypothetical protein